MRDALTLEPSQAGHVTTGRKELGDEQLFARLIGAAVLLALAVIVLPFVLDGSGSQREYEYAETLPVEPPRPVVEKSFSSRQPVTQPAPTREDVSARVPPTTSTTSLQAPPKRVKSGSQPTGSPVKTTQQLANQVASAASGGSGNSNVVSASGAGAAISTRSIQQGWNIQVASFVRDGNAAKLINKLRAQNLPVYANRVEGSARTIIRVLVGPFTNQIDALALQNRINRDYRVESLMVRRK